MREIILLFTVAIIFGLLSHEAKAQSTSGFNTFSQLRKASIHRPYPIYLQCDSILRKNRNEIGNVFIPESEAFQEKETAYHNLPKSITNAISKRMQKKTKKTIDSNSEVYLIDTVVEYANTDTMQYIYSYNKGGMAILFLRMQWQNGQWTNKYLDTYKYDANENLITRFTQKWQNGQWTNYGLETNTYNSNGYQLTNLGQNWQNDQWTNVLASVFTYDAEGNQLTSLKEYWKNDQWIGTSLVTCTYDSKGNQLTLLYEPWENGQWTNHGLQTFTYDSIGNQLTLLYQQWYNGLWNNVVLFTYTYDSKGNRLTILEVDWQNGQWTNAGLETYTYDSKGNQLTHLFQVWESDHWRNGELITNTYDAKSNLITQLEQFWYKEQSWQNAQWANNDSITYIYDANGNQFAVLVQFWENGQWTITSLLTEIYDASGNLITFTYRAWDNLVLVPVDYYLVISIDKNNFLYLNGYNATFKYKLTNITCVTSGEPGIPASFSLSQNYPNPFNPSTGINYSIPKSGLVTIKVYNVLGKEIATLVNEYRSAGNYSVQFNGSKLSSGIYFYRMKSGNFVQTKKLMLMK